MKLQEFLSFKKFCLICNEPITYRIFDWTNQFHSIRMAVSQIPNSSKLIKLSHKDISLFINLEKNTFDLYPNASKKIIIKIEGSCKKDNRHYYFDTQMMEFNYEEKTWSSIPNIDLIETIRVEDGNIFSIISSYFEPQSTLVLFKCNPNDLERLIFISLIDTTNISFQNLINNIKLQLTFK